MNYQIPRDAFMIRTYSPRYWYFWGLSTSIHRTKSRWYRVLIIYLLLTWMHFSTKSTVARETLQWMRHINGVTSFHWFMIISSEFESAHYHNKAYTCGKFRLDINAAFYYSSEYFCSALLGMIAANYLPMHHQIMTSSSYSADIAIAISLMAGSNFAI